MSAIIELSLWQLFIATSFVWLVLGLTRWLGLRREKEIIIASLRMTLQLVLIGYLLVFIFTNPAPLFSLGAVVVMQFFAIYTIIKRFATQVSFALQSVIALSMFLGTTACIGIFLFAVLGASPWYDPRYFIPISGMLIDNSMTGIALGIKSMLEGMQQGQKQIEERLMLGATPAIATRNVVKSSFDSAIMPTINSMLGMGVVFLPGMMTGQILSGTSPQTAIGYQIVFMLGILGAVVLSVVLMLHWGVKTFFTPQAQLKTDCFIADKLNDGV